MANLEIVCSPGPGETRLAVIADGRVTDLAVARASHAVGGIWLGRVLRVTSGGPAFVDIGQTRPGVLSAGTASEGEAILVQATADARADKGTELTAAVSLPGRLVAFTPLKPGVAVSRRVTDADERHRLLALARGLARPSEGIVLRTQAAGAGDGELAAEIDALREAWRAIGERAAGARPPLRLMAADPLTDLLAEHPGVQRIVVDDDAAFADLRRRYPSLAHRHRGGSAFAACGAEEALAQALEPVVPLTSGGSVVIEATAALTAIDVNSGAGHPRDANREAATEIARQLRLRGIGGHILIDFIPGRGAEHRRRLVDAMRAAVADDPVPTHVVGTSPLGMVEMTRGRRRPSLGELMEETTRLPTAETVGLDGLRRLVRAMARPGTPMVTAAPEVIDALRRLPDALAEVADRLGRGPTLRADPTRRRADLDITWE